jgi:type I restriction enzyme S subunit
MVEDVTRDKKFVTPQIDFLTREGAKRSRPCKRGTLTVVCSGTPGVVGMPAFLAVDACIHDGMMALVNISQKVVPDYLFHQLSSYQEKLYMAATHGGTFVNLTTTGLRAFKVALPPSETEQRAIADVLSDADALLSALDGLIAKKRDLKQGVMQQLLTGQIRLPGFSEEWEAKRLEEVVQPRMQRVDSRQSGTSEFCVELEHIEQGTGRLLGWTTTTASSSLRSVFRPRDVLFGRLRAYLRKFWIADRDGVCSTEIWVLVGRADLLDQGFLYHIVTSDRFIDAASSAYGTHMPRSDWNVVKNYEIPLPSLVEQTAIASVLSDMDAEIRMLEQRREKTYALKQAMMQELLTGRTRLLT